MPEKPGPATNHGSEIVRWAWGKGLHDLRPSYAERMRLTRVGPLAAVPADPKGFTEYGLDAAGRLVEARKHRGKGRTDVDRYSHGAEAIDVEHESSTPGVPLTHSRYSLVDGRIVAWRWQTPAGLVEEIYAYDNGVLASIRTVGPNDPPRVFRHQWGPRGLSASRWKWRARSGSWRSFARPRRSRMPTSSPSNR